MFLRISDTAKWWIQQVTKEHYDKERFEHYSLVGRYRQAEEKVNGARANLAQLVVLSQAPYEPRGFFSRRIKVLRMLGERSWRSNIAFMVTVLETKIEEYETMTNDILAKFAFHTFELGQALDRWLKLYNHLAEGQRLGQLSQEQLKSVQDARPILERALGYFEQCVSLHRWHTAHAQMKGVQPVAPRVGLQLEELQEVVTHLTACISDDTLDNASTMVEREVALVELQKQLGAIPEFSLGTA